MIVVKVNKSKEGDVKQLSRLIKKVIYGTPYYTDEGKRYEFAKYTPQKIRNKLKDDWLFLNIKDKGKIIAFLAGYFDCGTFWSDWIGVDSKYRGKGFGKNLKLELEEILIKKKIHKIWCDTRVVNKEAISLNSGLGYNKIAQLTNHWYKDNFYLWEKNLE